MALSKAAQQIEDEFTSYQARMEMAKAPAWRPEGASADNPVTIIGTVIGMEMRTSDYGKYPAITYRGEDGKVFVVHAFHQLLRERLAELKTDIGKKQILSCLGQATKNKATDEDRAAGKDKYWDYYAENFGEVSANQGKSEDFAF